MAKWTSLTVKERKHKSEYMKAGAKEVEFAKASKLIDIKRPFFDTKTGLVKWGNN